jgi:hypothetical protein
MSMTPSQEWMSRGQRDALVRGEGCPACAEVRSSEFANEHGYFVVDLEVSRLGLAANQYVRWVTEDGLVGIAGTLSRLWVRTLASTLPGSVFQRS